MGLTDEYIGKMANLNAAITDALANEVAEGFKQAVANEVLKDVYSYPATFVSRRGTAGGIADPENIITFANGDTLTADNVTGLQNLWGGGDSNLLTPIVEGGVTNYHMPGPRPFMENAKESFVSSGAAEAALRAGLRRQGIDESGMSFTFG